LDHIGIDWLVLVIGLLLVILAFTLVGSIIAPRYNFPNSLLHYLVYFLVVLALCIVASLCSFVRLCRVAYLVSLVVDLWRLCESN
jgi:hypothetical protein